VKIKSTEDCNVTPRVLIYVKINTNIDIHICGAYKIGSHTNKTVVYFVVESFHCSTYSECQ